MILVLTANNTEARCHEHGDQISNRSLHKGSHREGEALHWGEKLCSLSLEDYSSGIGAFADKVTPQQARKKWDKELKCPPSGSGTDNGEATAATWPWFSLMDEALGNRPSVTPPLLIASSNEEEPGPSSVVASPLSEQRGRKRQETLLDLLREDMEREREREERQERAEQERSDHLYNLLEKLVNKIN
ncbi:hypothetical protein AMEX_G5065 [Astyanax mexicanus]|uniref:Uncharacterized protein n=1 Tax=Astyanax mexicanus TaxID=7994 RepID=A0A8T2MCD6_ASTMX|nr:hypothetical protein AMEX_G5065 [Astyanax mexicanus]